MTVSVPEALILITKAGFLNGHSSYLEITFTLPLNITRYVPSD